MGFRTGVSHERRAIKESLGDERCTEAVLDFPRETRVGEVSHGKVMGIWVLSDLGWSISSRLLRSRLSLLSFQFCFRPFDLAMAHR